MGPCPQIPNPQWNHPRRHQRPDAQFCTWLAFLWNFKSAVSCRLQIERNGTTEPSVGTNGSNMIQLGNDWWSKNFTIFGRVNMGKSCTSDLDSHLKCESWALPPPKCMEMYGNVWTCAPNFSTFRPEGALSCPTSPESMRKCRSLRASLWRGITLRSAHRFWLIIQKRPKKGTYRNPDGWRISLPSPSLYEWPCHLASFAGSSVSN